jgi:hypothetical protein
MGSGGRTTAAPASSHRESSPQLPSGQEIRSAAAPRQQADAQHVAWRRGSWRARRSLSWETFLRGEIRMIVTIRMLSSMV